MEPGFTFDLQEHYKKYYNRKYLITDISHEGHQAGYLISGITGALEPRDEQMFYANTFTAIYSDVQFRPERTAVKPKVSGTVNAKVDAAASGQYAELDDTGRYKVILPFDRSGRGSGKASAWCRMMQPYAGAGYGMHFPLHKGIEVLLTFIDGDPDRPIIAGAVPNPETATPVTGKNQTRSIIKTGGGNAIALEDSEGGQLVKISSPTENSFLRIGAPNPSAPPGINIGTNNEMTTVVGGHTVTNVDGNDTVTIGGDQYQVTNGNIKREFHSNSHKITMGNQTEETYGNKTSTVNGSTKETFTGTKVTDSLAATQESFVGVKSSQALAATSELFVGIKQTACAAAEIVTTASLKYQKAPEHILNAASKLDKITGPCKEMVGTYELTSLGTLELDASGTIKINSSSKITLIAPEIELDGNVTVNKKLVAKKDVKMKGNLNVNKNAKDKNSDR
ncbi:MAG: type VI secretion system tip protein VgrG [Candidatus Electrothrix sp. AR4]|nr:type VI secretion system tip protein VgrG [Candidatus Electrothrix sp. AR4]